jgi:hypothetical protein
MADYVPFPERSDPNDDGELARRVAGCAGIGGATFAVVAIGAVVLIGLFTALLEGCDLDVASPGDGTESARLPVEVTPRTDLVDGATVRVTSRSFDPLDVVGVAVCLRKADTQDAGVDACDEVQGARYATDAQGRLDATYAVPRVITVGGRAYDCAATAERCLVVAADAGDYDRSGGQAITFRRGLPAADLRTAGPRPVSDRLPIGAEPALDRPVEAGTELQVLATGFQPGEPVLVAYCTDQVERDGMIDACEPQDASAVVTALLGRSVEGLSERANDDGAVVVTLEARGVVSPTVEVDASGSSTTAAGPGATVPLLDGQSRCTEAGGGCTIVVAAAADTKRSAILPYVVR